MNTKAIAVAAVVIIIVAAVGFVLLSSDDPGDDSKSNLDCSLEIFGNSNGDSRVDDADADLIDEYVQAMADGEADKGSELGINLEFADVNRDGDVDSEDADLARDIANHVEGTKMTLLDGKGNEKTITLRDSYVLASDYTTNAELVNILGVVDQVVAVDQAIYTMQDFYMANNPNKEDLVNYGNQNSAQVRTELAVEAGVNLWLCQTDSYTDIKANAVGEAIYLGLSVELSGKPSESVCGQAILKAGYIFDKVDRAEAYVSWLDGIYDTIYDRTKDLSDDDRPTVLMSYYGHYMTDQTTKTIYAYSDSYLDAQAAELAGARNIILDHTSDYTSSINLSLEKMVDWEDEIDYVMIRTIYLSGSGGYIEGVPKNGYTIDDATEMEEAPAYLHSLDLLSGIDENQFKLFCGYLTNDSTCVMLCAAYYAPLFQPELFGDFDAEAIHQKYITDWLGIDYDLSEHGVFTAF